MNGLFCVAVHGLIYLDKRGCMLSSEELAANICTNPARVRKVLAGLKKAGLVETREGSEGGYRFAGEPESLTLDRVAAAVDARFVAARWRSGSLDQPCLVASGMADVMDGLLGELDDRCRAYLSTVTLAELDRRLKLVK